MGVRIGVSGTYKTQVKGEVMAEDGKKEELSFTAEFKRLKRDAIATMIEECKNDAEMCRRVLVGWKLTRLDTGVEWPFSPENFEEFLNEPGYAGLTMIRFMETVGANRSKT